VTNLHIRASQWFEENGLEFEAFQHAAAANDVARAEHLIDSKGMNLHYRSVATAVLTWLAALPPTLLDRTPSLWVRSATLALMAGQTSGVEEKLQAAEKALQNYEEDARRRDLIGQIACARATLALTHYDPETMIIQARRALEYLPPEDLTFLFTANWALASAYFFQGERAAAAQATMESISICQKSGDAFSNILATSHLAQLQELENKLYQAAETYRSILPMFGDHPLANAEEVQLGLARISYEWNDLEAAEQHGQLSLQLARQYDRLIDRYIVSEVFLARVRLARGEVDQAAALLAQAKQSAGQEGFVLRMPEIAARQVAVMLREERVDSAAQLAQQYNLPLCHARVLLAQGKPSAALEVLEPLRQQAENRNWQDERLKIMVLQAVALQANGEKDLAVQLLGQVLGLAEPGGFIRTFVDEGEMMRLLIEDFRLKIEKKSSKGDPARGWYMDKILAAFAQYPSSMQHSTIGNQKSTILEPLSLRELEILKLIAQGLSNREIGERLFLALDTVKGHNRRIFDKLQVQSRTEAVARGRELGLM
jgi:LuxR family maltose regulon positive regulatory protein